GHSAPARRCSQPSCAIRTRSDADMGCDYSRRDIPMNPRQLDHDPDRWEPRDGRSGSPGERGWQRDEARQRFLALASAYEELGSSPEEAQEAALRQLAAETGPPQRGDLFPTFRAAARAARRRARFAALEAPDRIGRLARGLLTGTAWVLAALTCLLLIVTLAANGIAGPKLEQELAQVRSRGEPLTLREIAPPPVPDAENAALV